MFYDNFFIKKTDTKENPEYMLTWLFSRDKFKLFLDLVDDFRC